MWNLHASHGRLAKFCSTEHLPQIIRFAIVPIESHPASSWHTGHGCALPQHGKRNQRRLFLKWSHAPRFGSSVPSMILGPDGTLPALPEMSRAMSSSRPRSPITECSSSRIFRDSNASLWWHSKHACSTETPRRTLARGYSMPQSSHAACRSDGSTSTTRHCRVSTNPIVDEFLWRRHGRSVHSCRTVHLEQYCRRVAPTT
mmetsp:Transcript_4791/g.12266  ORF Transcript_4791/g.12266 Transcript_4791/m.12266 type:complete len:201 (-) Transcript_4791:591-1193(-)